MVLNCIFLFLSKLNLLPLDGAAEALTSPIAVLAVLIDLVFFFVDCHISFIPKLSREFLESGQGFRIVIEIYNFLFTV